MKISETKGDNNMPENDRIGNLMEIVRELTDDDLGKVLNKVREEHDYRMSRAGLVFRIGERVHFDTNRRTFSGTIRSINKTSVRVLNDREDGDPKTIIFMVSPTMLRRGSKFKKGAKVRA